MYEEAKDINTHNVAILDIYVRGSQTVRRDALVRRLNFRGRGTKVNSVQFYSMN